LLETGETSLAINGVSSGLKRNGEQSLVSAETSTAQEEEASSKKKKKKKRKSKSKKGASQDENRLCGPPKPRNFLEAALYFSTITLGTVSMANQLDADVFFAPPLLFLTLPEEYEEIFRSRRIRSGPEYEGNKYLQRRISALFAVALSQSSPALRPFTTFDRNSKGSAASSAKTNYLKRSIGFFAVSLVDHLPPAMSNRLFKTGDNGGAQESARSAQKSLGLDELRVPSPETLAQFWLSLPMEERLRLVQEEAMGLAKGWINPKKTWCMCKYCKHRRLRLSDIFDHTYRAYHEELVNFELTMKGIEPPAPTPHQVKVRKLLYKALSVVAEDILNTKSRLMLEAISRLSRVFHEGLVDPSMVDCDGSAKCHCEDCAYFDDEDHDDDDRYDGSDFDDLDIEEDGDFYEDYNYGEDDDYIQMESEIVIDEAQLPSTLPTFYDMDLLGDQPRILDHCAEGELLFQSFISQVFQFHLVPAYLESESLRKQQQLIAAEEEAARLAKEREEQKQIAKQLKKERQKASRLAAAASSPAASPEMSASRPEPTPIVVEEVKQPEPQQPTPKPAPPKEKKVKKPIVIPEVIVPRAPIIHYDTSSFAVEDIRDAVEEESIPIKGSAASSSKGKKNKKKTPTTNSSVVEERAQKNAYKVEEKEEQPMMVSSSHLMQEAEEEEEPMPSWALEDVRAEASVEVDLPPGLFGASSFFAGSTMDSTLSGLDSSSSQVPCVDDPPPPYSSFFPLPTKSSELGQEEFIAEEALEEDEMPPGMAPSMHRYQEEASFEQRSSRFLSLFNAKQQSSPPAYDYGYRSFVADERDHVADANEEPYYSGSSSRFPPPRSRHPSSYAPAPPAAPYSDYREPYHRQHHAPPHYDHPDYDYPYRHHPPAPPRDYSRGTAAEGRARRDYAYEDDPYYYYARPPPPPQRSEPDYHPQRRPERPPMWRGPSQDSVAPGREGFNPFEDWSPVKSSLFSTPLFPKSGNRPKPRDSDE
jgi:hypothetical protein